MWPYKPEAVHEIPHTVDPGGIIHSVDPATERGLLELVHTYNRDLEAVTGGDVNKEQLLGDLLIRSAVYAANRRERAMRGLLVG